MEISPQITVALKPAGTSSGLTAGMFQPGDTFRLKIIELRGDRALIDFGRFRTTADVKIPVSRGDELRVRVLQSGRQLKLTVVKPVTDPPAAGETGGQGPAALRAADPAEARLLVKEAITRLLARAAGGRALPSLLYETLIGLQGHCEPLDLNQAVSELIPQLKTLLENSGLFLEKKLENLVLQLPPDFDPAKAESRQLQAAVKKIFALDLKAGLSVLQQMAIDAAETQNMLDSKIAGALSGSIDTLLTDIVTQQQRAVKRLPTPEPCQAFAFCLPLNEDGRQVRLKVFYPRKRMAERGSGFRISILLSLDRLGDVRTDFLLLDNDLSLTFFVKDRRAQTRIEENQDQLSAVLAGFFDRVGCKVMVSEKKVLEFERQDAWIDSERKVDIRI